VARLLSKATENRIYLVVAVPELTRQMLVQLPAESAINVAELPAWRGLGISIRRLDVADVHNEPFLVLQQDIPGTEKVYEMVIDDLAQTLLDGPTGRSLSELLENALGRWSSFFSQHGFDGLSPEQQRGLYGELWFLRDHLVSRLGALEATRAWSGFVGAPQDFQLAGRAIELKTSTAKLHHKVGISNELQLDDRGLESLHLGVLLLGELDGAPTLPALVADLDLLVQDEPGATTAFRDGLRSAGYLDAHADHYTAGYVFRSFRCFRVGEGFPRILDTDIPEGVGDVRFTIAIAACASFEVTIEAALADFARGLDPAP
jgi:hypothetical protein